MNENKALCLNNRIERSEKTIGRKTYVVTVRFNGDKKTDLVSAFVRLIGKDIDALSDGKAQVGA